MATALAPNLADSCAAFRAGVRRVSELCTVSPDDDERLGEQPIAGCRAAYLSEGYCLGAKTVLLGGIAIADLLQRRPLTDGAKARTGLALHVSDTFLLDAVAEPPEEEHDEHVMPSVAWHSKCASLIPKMLAGSGLSVTVEDRHVTFGGHAGFVDALRNASEMVASGRLDRCVVGAVDSCLDPEFLVAAAVKGLLKTSLNPAGFLPGEAAAFVLVERTADLRRTELRPLASFACGPLVPGTCDRFSGEPPDGAILARAIHHLLAVQQSRTEIGLLIADLNGDDYRARNWGSALVRLRNHRGIANAPMWIPALGFGETGSASGAVGLCLAARAMERGHLREGTALIWLSDESGAGAAVMVLPETEV
jgi:3-oxoacyl-[acyl-carrier-protein] synthase-1